MVLSSASSVFEHVFIGASWFVLTLWPMYVCQYRLSFTEAARASCVSCFVAVAVSALISHHVKVCHTRVACIA